MSKEEFLKIQTCALKVKIQCDGCKQKVKKILQKIDGVFTIKLDSDTGKVTVSGNADPDLLIKKLNKAGKHAELWGSQKPSNNNQSHLNLTNQLKNMRLDGNKGGGGGGGGAGNNKGQKGGGGGNNLQQYPNQQKGGPQGLTPQQQQQQQLQHQIKGFQDLKLPQFNNLKMPSKDQPPSSGGKPGAMSFHDDDDLVDDDDFDDEYDDDGDEFDDDDDVFDDDMDEVHHPVNKMKPGMGNGPGPNMMKSGNGGGGGGNGGKKGGGPGSGAIPVQLASGNNGNGKKGGGGGGGSSGGNHPNQGAAGGGKNVGGTNIGMPSSGRVPEKNGNHGGGGPMVNGNSGVGGKKGGGGNSGGGAPFKENGFSQMGGNPKMPLGGQTGNMPMSQMGNLQAVHVLPAASMASGGGSDAYHRGSEPAGNPCQQQYLASVMNQQRAVGNERFQPMMYARPPPAVNYMPAPYPSQYPYPQQGVDPYSYYFSEENPSGCNVM